MTCKLTRHIILVQYMDSCGPQTVISVDPGQASSFAQGLHHGTQGVWSQRSSVIPWFPSGPWDYFLWSLKESVTLRVQMSLVFDEALDWTVLVIVWKKYCEVIYYEVHISNLNKHIKTKKYAT